MTLLDIDVCATNTTNACDVNADCNDDDGSYTCTCKDGWTGDGFYCSGMWSPMCIFSKLSAFPVFVFMIYSILKCAVFVFVIYLVLKYHSWRLSTLKDRKNL